jgi:hypothetical protein
MNEKVYSYKLPLGMIAVIALLAIVVEGTLVYLAETNIRPWLIEGIHFSASNARIVFWIAGGVGLVFFVFMLFVGLFSFLTGKIRLSPDRIIAPKGAFSIKTVAIPYSSIKFLNVATRVIKSQAQGAERKARTLNIFHEGGKTYITEGLLSSPAIFDEIYLRLFNSISPVAQQFTENKKRQVPSVPR